jgi:hypothetical protein
MATQRLESGQMQLRGAGNVPMVQVQPQQVDFVGPRVAAQASNQLAQIIDRMTASTLEVGKQMRIEEGWQYAEENRLTEAQLLIAKGETPEKLNLPTTRSFGYFAQAVAKARSIEISGHFEQEGRNELARLIPQIDNGTITPEQARQKITAVVDGYSKSELAKEPEAMIKFRATMLAHGNTVMNRAYEREAQQQSELKKIKVDQEFENSTILVKAAIERGYWEIPGTKEMPTQRKSIEALIDVERKNVDNRAVTIGSAAVQKEYKDKFEKMVSDAKIDVLSTFATDTSFATNAMNAIGKLDKNEVGKYIDVWNTMSFSEKAKVRQNLRQTQIERQTTQDQADKDTDELDTIAAAELQSEYFRTGDKKVLDKLQSLSIRNPKIISPETVFELPEKRKVPQKPNFKGEYLLKDEIFRGLHPSPDSAKNRAIELGIGYEQFVEKIFPYFNTRNNADLNDVQNMFRNVAKIVPGQLNVGNKQATAFLALEKKFNREFPLAVAEARKKNQNPPTAKAFAQSIIESRTSSAANKMIENNYSALNDKYGINGSIRKTQIVFGEDSSYADIASQAARLKLTENDLNDIRQRLNIIDTKRQELDAE